MVRYIISKYNPKFRDEHGCYTKDEWTSISDIGECFQGVKMSLGEYLDMERRYIKALNVILDDLKVEHLYVMELEKEENEIIEITDGLTKDIIETINCIEEGKELNREGIEHTIIGVLRELFWCGLYSKGTHIIIRPGYDFYMHLICRELSQNITDSISNIGLFIEKYS